MDKLLTIFMIFLWLQFISPLHSADAYTFQNYQIPSTELIVFEPKPNKAVQYQKALCAQKLVVLVDRSWSMMSQDQYHFNYLSPPPPSKFTAHNIPGLHWKRMDSAFLIASHLANTIFKYDETGTIPVYFFGTHVHKLTIQNTQDLFNGFGPHAPDQSQSTNLYDALNLAFEENITPTNQVLFLVITDGEANGSKKNIEKLIYNKVAKKDPKGHRLNILFVQIGDDDKATAFLQYLDEGSKRIRKNVDVKKDDWIYTQPGEKVFLEAIFEDQM